MEPEQVIQRIEKLPIYLNKLLQKLSQLKEIKKNQSHSSDIESEIAFIEFKIGILKDNFEIIIDFLNFNMDLLDPHLKEIDDLFE